MKRPLSYFLISGVIILSVFIGTLVWRNQHLNEVPKFTEKTFTAPISSKYVPKNADLVFHWKINPSILPDYIGNYQDKASKNITNKQVKLIRDSSLKLISIDFTKDISKFSGGYGSFALFEINKKDLGWLMVLEANQDINIDEQLESISDPDIIDKNINSPKNLNISKSKLFSKKINSNQSIYFSNDKEHILISSNPKIIESSTDNKRSDILNTKEKYKKIQIEDKVNDGILLLEVSPKNILNLIGQKKNLLRIDQAENLLSSINIENKKLILEGIATYATSNKREINDLSYNLINMEKEFNIFEDSILINNPKQYFGDNSSHPYQKLISSLLQKSMADDYSKIIKIILENTKGNFIWAKDQKWVAMTRKDDKEKQEINDVLKKDKFLNSKLEFRDKNLEVWSKITTNKNDKYEINENIEAIIEESEDKYIWSKDLSSISNLNKRLYSQNNRDNEYAENENNDFDDIIRIHLGKEKTEMLLKNFYPYTLLRTMLGNQLNFPQRIDITASIPTINYPNYIKFKIKMETS